MPTTWSRGNPVDILGDANGERYTGGARGVLADKRSRRHSGHELPDGGRRQRRCRARRARASPEHAPRAPILTCWLGETAAEESRRLFAAKRLPSYETPNEAVRALMQLVNYRRNQDLLLETPPAVRELVRADGAAARALIAKVLADKSARF